MVSQNSPGSQDSSNHLMYRLSRDRMLDMVPYLSPIPATDIPIVPENFLDYLSQPGLVVGTVPADTAATITFPFSQAGVSYQLFYKNGLPASAAVMGTCGPLAIETPPLPREWHEFYIEAVKVNIGEPQPGLRRLQLEVWINAGHNDGIDPTPMLQILPYEGSYTLQIPDCPPNIRILLRDRAGQIAGEGGTGKKGGLIEYPLGPFHENDSYVLHAINLPGGKERDLVQMPIVYVYPNPHLAVIIASPVPVPYGGSVTIAVLDSQASCEYQVAMSGEGGHGLGSDVLQGNGGRLELQVFHIEDDVTAKVWAHKLEGNLELFLNQTRFIPVYPNPNMGVSLLQNRIPYAEWANVRVIPSQPGVEYWVEDHLGNALSPKRNDPTRSGRVSIWIGPNHEDLNLRVRAFRHGVDSLLHAGVTLYVGPRLDLPMILASESFAQETGGGILLKETQASVRYTLYKIPGTETQWGAPLEVATLPGTGGDLVLPMGPLPEFQYRFYVIARKPSSGMEGRLTQEIEVQIGVRRDLQVDFGASVLNYEAFTTALVPQPQPQTGYRLVDEYGRPIGDLVTVREVDGFHLVTYPMQEDFTLYVEGVNRFTGNTAILFPSQQVILYPNPNFHAYMESHLADYGGLGQLAIANAQRSVVYRVIGRPRLPWQYEEPLPEAVFEAQPGANGYFRFEFGPVTFSMDLDIVAEKPLTGLTVVQPYNQDTYVWAGPNPNYIPELLTHPVPYGGSAMIRLPETDYLTYYWAAFPDTGTIGPRVYSQQGEELTLDTFPLHEDSDIYVHAMFEWSQQQARLHTPVHVQVMPSTGFQVQVESFPFDPSVGLVLRVWDTQETADYTLFMIPGDGNAWFPRLEGATIAGNGGEIRFHTGTLDMLRYTFYIHVQKRESGLFARPRSAVMLYAGVRRDNPVSLAESILQYGGMTNLTIFNTQPDAEYMVIGRDGEILGGGASPGEGMTLELTLMPLFEDVALEIRCTNLLTGQSALLDAGPEISVYPNANLFPVQLNWDVAWMEGAKVAIKGTQESVTYVAIFEGSDDPDLQGAMVPGTVIGSARPQSPSDLVMDTDGLRWDLRFSMLARKTMSGLAVALPGIFWMRVGPDPGREVYAVDSHPDDTGGTEVILPHPQLGVRYQLRNFDTGDWVGSAYYPGPLVGIGVAQVGHTFTVAGEAGAPFALHTGPLTESVELEVVALKLMNGHSTVLEDRIRIDLPA